jgi:hypothetical protein
MVDPLGIINTCLCAVIALRLMFFRKAGASHCWWASWLAYLLVLYYGGTVIDYAFDKLAHVSLEATTFNFIVAVLVLRAKGNAAKLLSRHP